MSDHAPLDAAPAPTEDRWDYDAHPGDCHPRREPDGTWTVCCRECAGTGVFPVPWINSPAEGRADMDRCSDVRCKGTGRAVIGFAAAPTTTGDTDLLSRAIRTLLPGLRIANYVERWSPTSPAVRALGILCEHVGEPVEAAGDLIHPHVPTAHPRRPEGEPATSSTSTSPEEGPMILVTVNTGHFEFTALAESVPLAQRALIEGYREHARQTPGASRRLMVDLIRDGEVNYTPITPGVVLRDGSPIAGRRS